MYIVALETPTVAMFMDHPEVVCNDAWGISVDISLVCNVWRDMYLCFKGWVSFMLGN